MSPHTSDIFGKIQQLNLQIDNKRSYYIESIHNQLPFEVTRAMFLEIKELEKQKKELGTQLSQLMNYDQSTLKE